MPSAGGSSTGRVRAVAGAVLVMSAVVIGFAVRWPSPAGQSDPAASASHPSPVAGTPAAGPVVVSANEPPSSCQPPQVPLSAKILGRQWALQSLDAAKAWTYSDGAGVKVAVVDTGIDSSNPDLRGAVIGGGSGDHSADSHGTAIAGIIAGRGAQNMFGLAPCAQLINIQVTNNENQVSANEIVNGIKTAVANGAQIINVSLVFPLTNANGNGRGLQQIQDAVNYAWNHNSLVVASVGNKKPLSYAQGSNMLAVAAVGMNEQPLESVDPAYGPHYMYAPGHDLYSTVKGGGYASETGNDFATAYVSAAAALVWSADLRSAGQSPSPAKVRTQLLGNPNPSQGAPPVLLNVVSAMKGLAPLPTPKSPSTSTSTAPSTHSASSNLPTQTSSNAVVPPTTKPSGIASPPDPVPAPDVVYAVIAIAVGGIAWYLFVLFRTGGRRPPFWRGRRRTSGADPTFDWRDE
jgi:subtilisin family serine protease